MDQDQFRTTYREINQRFCAYEKSVLTNQCDCTQVERFCIAEREGAHCNSDSGHGRCQELLELLRAHARFALKALGEKDLMPHGKAMKVQVGGLRGIKLTLEPDKPTPATIDDVDGTILAAIDHFGGLEKLPFQTIIQQIAAYQVKKRSRRRDR